MTRVTDGRGSGPGLRLRDQPDCLVCLVRQAVEAGRFLGLAPATREALVRQTLRQLVDCDWQATPPAIAAETQACLRDLAGDDDPYRAVKAASTAAALALVPAWQAAVAAAPDPLEQALRLAAAGNLIDCGPTGSLDLAAVVARLELAGRRPLPAGAVTALRERLATARSCLLIADNAGELVADRVLLETLAAWRPGLALAVLVRGGPVLNDATRDDARASGLPPRVAVLDSGLRLPGLDLARSPEAVRAAFAAADVVVAKGQGNWETLAGTLHPGLFFLLTAKCPAVAATLGVTTGSAVLRAATEAGVAAAPAGGVATSLAGEGRS